MTFIWKSVQSFKQHISDMKLFRQSHGDIPRGEDNLVGNMPRQGDIEPPFSAEGTRVIVSTKRKTKLVPIWDIELPRGIQN